MTCPLKHWDTKHEQVYHKSIKANGKFVRNGISNQARRMWSHTWKTGQRKEERDKVEERKIDKCIQVKQAKL